MDDDTFLYIITFFVVIGSIALLLIEYVFKKWKCKEGKCEKVFGGDYSTVKECLASKECAKTPASDILQNPRDKPTGYECIGNTCTPSNTPKFINIADCQSTCGVTEVVNVPDYSYGYPYSYDEMNLYPYGANYGYGRRWWPRRRSPRRRSPRRRSPGRRRF